MSEVLSFKYPPINPAVTGNLEQWREARPINGSVFRSDQNQSIIINVASNSEYLKTVQSFLDGKLVPRAADGSEVSTGTTNTKQGMSRAFSRLVIRIGGAICEDIHFYNDVLGLSYSTLSPGRKSLLKRLEGFGDTGWFGNGGRRFAHMIFSSLWVTNQSIPLPFVTASGVSLELYLAPANEIYTSANVVYYTIEDVSLKYQAITPDPAYTIQMRNAIASGRSAFIPYQRIHVFPSNGNGSNNQIINVAIGQVSSIVGIETVFYDSTTYNTVDKYNRFVNANLVSWSVEGGGVHNPNQIEFKYDNGDSPETTLMSLMSEVGNIYNIGSEIDLPDTYDTEHFRIGLNFQSSLEHHGSGLSTIGAASPFLTIRTKHSAPVNSSVTILTFCTTDALLEFRGGVITPTEVF